jgi:uncharacterized protein with von Willebrand factor type A (vWA) domain
VPDWSGGTRIGDGLHAFNRDWLRRLPGGATVWLVTDGLDRGDDPACARLAAEAERLRLSCRELVWLNPLLRYAGFEPRAAGVRALLPRVSRHVPGHDLDSIERLVASLTENARRS